ncbi:MAG: DUF1893 domain-containing protein [Candidatus Izemoplasmatales bacterium]|nr:DUF1893 domain-containing protein [Candidatus Izemoplasmatales bacterium]
MHKYLTLLENHTCVIIKNEKVEFSSSESGVKPLLDYYRLNGISQIPLIVVDKIMGRGAVLLAKMINAIEIVTPIISKDALELAKHYKMKVYYDEVVEFIVNRNRTGRCPIEASVLGITDVMDGYNKITETLQGLSQK